MITFNAEYPVTSAADRPAKIDVMIDDDTINRLTMTDLTDLNDLVCDTLHALGSPGHAVTVDNDSPAMIPDTTGKTVTIRTYLDRGVRVFIGDEEIASANHDEHGWSGIDAVTKTAQAVARAAGLPVVEDEDSGEAGGF